jgi:ring-1,2-phenylacetyl-CoA epoxidase subunit PaaA
MSTSATAAIVPLIGPHSVKTPEDFRHMPQEYQDLATRLMLVHTEGELTGADDYTQVFYALAPDAYEKFVCCERAAEEVDHYRLGAAVLDDIGVDTTAMLKQDFRERSYYPNELVRGVKTWMERGIFSFIGEAIVLEHLFEFEQSSYQPFADIFIKQIIKDEHVHVAHGYRIVRTACKTEEGHAEVQAALNRLWPHLLDLFGRSDSKRSPLYVKWGLRQTTNAELRRHFAKKMVQRLKAMNLSVPDAHVGRAFL